MLAVTALGGAVLVVLGGGKTGNASIQGDLWAVSNCITWAIYFLMVKRQRDLGAKLWGFLAPVMFWTTIFAFIGPLFLDQSLAVGSAFNWLMVLSVGFLSMTAHALLTWAQRNMEATYTSLLMLGMPIISAISAYVVFREKLSALQFLGGFIVVTSLALVTLVSSRLNRSLARVPDPA
jgi:drug/metabolite transporter (DMT)-like permease